MYGLFAGLIVLVAIMLVLIVLVQNSKGGGLAANFASANQTFGVRQTTDILEKFTWYFIAALLVLCLGASATIPRDTVQSSRDSAVQKQMGGAPVLNQQFPVSGAQPEGGQQQEGEPQPAQPKPQE